MKKNSFIENFIVGAISEPQRSTYIKYSHTYVVLNFLSKFTALQEQRSSKFIKDMSLQGTTL